MNKILERHYLLSSNSCLRVVTNKIFFKNLSAMRKLSNNPLLKSVCIVVFIAL